MHSNNFLNSPIMILVLFVRNCWCVHSAGKRIPAQSDPIFFDKPWKSPIQSMIWQNEECLSLLWLVFGYYIPHKPMTASNQGKRVQARSDTKIVFLVEKLIIFSCLEVYRGDEHFRTVPMGCCLFLWSKNIIAVEQYAQKARLVDENNRFCPNPNQQNPSDGTIYGSLC